MALCTWIILFIELNLITNLSADKIQNLQSHLDVFEQCIIHLLNYNGIDFHGFKAPVVLSRYIVDQSKRQLKFYTHGDLPENRNKTEVQNFYRLIPYQAPCVVHFYLHPPAHGKPYIFMGFYRHYKYLVIPQHYWLAWEHHDKWDITNFVYSRQIYQILVADTNANKIMWKLAIEFFVQFLPVTHILIFETKNIDDSDKEIVGIQTTQDVHDVLLRVYVPLNINFSTALRSDLDAALWKARLHNNITYWGAISTRVDPNNPDFQRWLQEINKVLRLHRDIIPFRKLDILSTKFGLTIEHINFALINPNISFGLLTDPCAPFYTRENLEPAVSGICDNHITMPTVYFDKDAELVFIQQSEYYKFLACGQVEMPQLSFYGLVSAFDYLTWTILILTYMGLHLAHHFLLRSFRPRDFLKLIIDSLSIFIEQEDTIASNDKKLNSLYWTYGPLILMGVVLSNAYKGENIGELTAPLPPTLLTNFSQLVTNDYKIFSPMTKRYKDSTQYHFQKNLTRVEEFRLNEPNNSQHRFFLTTTEFKEIIQLKKVPVDQEIKDRVSYHREEAWNVIRSTRGNINENFSFVPNLAECNNTAVVGWSPILENLNIEVQRLRVKSPSANPGHISMSKEFLVTRDRGWQLAGWRNTDLFRKLMVHWESGIMRQWMNFNQLLIISKNQQLSRIRDDGDDTGSPKALKLKGNSVSLFIVLSVGLVLGFSLFIAEWITPKSVE